MEVLIVTNGSVDEIAALFAKIQRPYSDAIVGVASYSSVKMEK